jgi:hypothetical protein
MRTASFHFSTHDQGDKQTANNRQVGVAAGVSDQGQMSRLLARLEGLGLLENRGTRALGAPYAWHLTARGAESLREGESSGPHNNGEVA